MMNEKNSFAIEIVTVTTAVVIFLFLLITRSVYGISGAFSDLLEGIMVGNLIFAVVLFDNRKTREYEKRLIEKKEKRKNRAIY